MILISFAEEEEEEAEEAVEPQSIPPDLESYEARAERVLEEQRERVSIAPELDYIDEEDEDVQPQVIKRIGLSLQKFLKRYLCKTVSIKRKNFAITLTSHNSYQQEKKSVKYIMKSHAR